MINRLPRAWVFGGGRKDFEMIGNTRHCWTCEACKIIPGNSYCTRAIIPHFADLVEEGKFAAQCNAYEAVMIERECPTLPADVPLMGTPEWAENVKRIWGES